MHPEIQNVDLDNQDKYREHLSFENVSVNIFNTYDEVMENMDNVDNAILILQRFGADQRNIEGATMEYFKVNPLYSAFQTLKQSGFSQYIWSLSMFLFKT